MATEFQRGAISLGDLAIALKRLHPATPAEAASIGNTLGFGLADPTPAAAKQTGAYDVVHNPATEAHAPKLPSWKNLARDIDPERLAQTRSPSSPSAPPELRPGFITRIAEQPRESISEPVEPPAWILSAASITSEPTGLAPPPRKPLLPENTSRAVLSAATATRTFEGALDVAALVVCLAERRHLRRFPRLPVATLRRGVQLLIDQSTGMTPFLHDLNDLEACLRNTIGRDRVWTSRFSGIPEDASKPARNRSATHALKPDVPVVIATDFGLGTPLEVGDKVPLSQWFSFAERTRKAGLPVVGLIPLKPRHWPLPLRRWFTLVHWDPLTTARAVRRAVGPGHPING